MRAVFVHGACVRDGAWWWSRVAAELRTAGVESVAVPLASCGETGGAPGADGPGLDADVAEVQRVLADGVPSVVVAHSYGGVVATEAADGVGDVRHLVYVTSFLPAPGESLSTFGGDQPAPHLEVTPDGTFGLRLSAAEPLYLQDCDREAIDGAVARLTRQTVAVTMQPVRHAAWRSIPSTYVVCTDDRGTPAAVQRLQAARADRVIELPTGHHPMLSRPDLLAPVVLAPPPTSSR